MSIIYIVKQSIDGKKIKLKKVLFKSLFKWPIATGTNIMMMVLLIIPIAPAVIYFIFTENAGIIFFALLLLSLIPIIIYSIYWCFIIYPIVFYNKSWQNALDYSKSVVENRWWKVFGYFIVFNITGMIIGIIIGFIESLILNLFDYSPVITIVLDSIVDIIFAYFVVILAVFFINLDSTKKSKKKKMIKNNINTH